MPTTEDDWLIVAGDVAEEFGQVKYALARLSERFAKVIWVPGNHELWTPPRDPVQLRGENRYRRLVDVCRSMGVLTPEDPYPTWQTASGPIVIAPLFLLYDYSFRPAGTFTKEEALSVAASTGVICTDEYLLHPDPHPSREDWCRERVAYSKERLDALEGAPTVLVNHWPLHREPTQILRHPEFALWCGTDRTAAWHVQYNARVVVYGHLHIPRTSNISGVRFDEVSVGYPREWKAQRTRANWLHEVLPGAAPNVMDARRSQSIEKGRP